MSLTMPLDVLLGIGHFMQIVNFGNSFYRIAYCFRVKEAIIINLLVLMSPTNKGIHWVECLTLLTRIPVMMMSIFAVIAE